MFHGETLVLGFWVRKVWGCLKSIPNVSDVTWYSEEVGIIDLFL